LNIYSYRCVKKMKICVTATASDLNAQIDPRFGRSQYFVIVDSDTLAFEVVPNEAVNAPGGAGIQAAQAMVNKGVDVVISGSIGPNAFQVLSTAGVKVATGAYGTVKEAVEMYKSGKLSETGTSTVAAHTGMGAGVAPGMGRGRGGGRGMQQPMPPQQPQQMPVEPKAKEGDVEPLSEIVETLEKNLGEVKKRIEELKKR
jgi:predicted Fe-Mo cluster-binding NifX family protein